MSKLQVNDIVNKDDDGSVGFSRGAVVTGVLTATTGNITGNMTVGGVLTYEDVTNIDSVGLITARSGIEFGASGVGGTITSVGNAEFVGVITARSGIQFGASGVGGTITSVGNAEFVGVLTASSFVGDGTGLTGVASTDNIITSTASTFANINSTGIISATSFEGNFILDSYLFN